MVVNRPKKDTPFSIGDSNNDCADFVQGWHTTAAWVASAQTTKSQADRIVLFPNSDSSVRAGSDRNASIEHAEPNDGTTTGKQRSRWPTCKKCLSSRKLSISISRYRAMARQSSHVVPGQKANLKK